MAYNSSGRKPFERASKISHAQIINNPAVQAMLARCTLPAPSSPDQIAQSLIAVPDEMPEHINYVVAVDGSLSEAPVRPQYPAAVITFFVTGPLLFSLRDLDRLAEQPTIDPADMTKLKKISRHSLVLPTANVSLDGRDLASSVRSALHEFLCEERVGTRLQDTLRWLVFEQFHSTGPSEWHVPSCPYDCGHAPLVFRPTDPDEHACPSCGKPVWLVDMLRLHERIDDESGAGAVSSYVLSALETLVLIDVIRQIVQHYGAEQLRTTAFIKDGPLATFGVISGLVRPLRSLSMHLMASRASRSVLNLVGLEKSGPFVEHAQQIEDRIPPGHALLLTDDYIKRYIMPGNQSPDVYGRTTYWGNKLIFKAPDCNLYVASVPAGDLHAAPTVEDFSNLFDVLAVIARLRCSMYDNALLPVALANKLVSLSEYPSTEILRIFATETVA
jgi:hypothetical protein